MLSSAGLKFKAVDRRRPYQVQYRLQVHLILVYGPGGLGDLYLKKF